VAQAERLIITSFVARISVRGLVMGISTGSLRRVAR